MSKNKFNPCLPAAMVMILGMSSCVDNDYDLSDIDSTVRVEVKDLTVPINIDRITLSSILNIKEGDRLQLVDGVYAVMENGEFTSSDIQINAFHFPAPTVKSTDIVISATGANAPGKRIPGKLSFNLATTPEQVAYHADNVPANIISLGKIGCNFGFNLRIAVPQLGQLFGSVSLEGVRLQLPRGLEFSSVPNDSYNYNPATGEFVFTQALSTDSNGALTLQFAVSAIDAALATSYHYDTHTLDFNSSVGVTGGNVTVDPSSLGTSVNQISISSVNLKVDYNFSDFDVTSVGGVIRYDLDGFNVSDISLNNLPDILSQEGTNIGIANPQIFLSLNNPLNDYGVYASTGISIIPVRDNQPGTTYGLDNGSFEIGRPYNTQGMYYYLLSPSASNVMSFPEFPNPVHVGYSNLSLILEGNGIPDALRVEFDNAQLPQQEVSGLPLGRPLGKVEGKYKFVAPLQFTDGSTIVYSSTETGWGSEDLDALTITGLDIDLDLTSDLPIAVDFTGYPIDAAGHRINNVEIVGANIQPNAANQHVTIGITGNVTGLDGIIFEARATSHSSSSALSPDMTIRLDKIRPRVSGYYQKEL